MLCVLGEPFAETARVELLSKCVPVVENLIGDERFVLRTGTFVVAACMRVVACGSWAPNWLTLSHVWRRGGSAAQKNRNYFCDADGAESASVTCRWGAG